MRFNGVEYYTTTDILKTYQISRTSLNQYVSEKKINPLTVPGINKNLFLKGDIDEFFTPRSKN